MTISINPGNYTGGAFNSLQNQIDSHDEIHFKPGTFLIGSNTILLRGPKKITGVPGSTFIKGTSGYLLANIIPVITDPHSKIGSGIFSILGNGAVSITGLHLNHTADPSPAPIEGNNAHGSGTICYFVDNAKPSSLVVTDCVIDTTATGAINVDSINPPNSAQPATHDLIIRRCKIPGRNPGPNHVLAGNPGAGNWLSVKLGPMPLPGANPVDMRSSYFEVNDCDLDPATFAAVAVWLCESDSASEFVISNNRIAQSPGAGVLDFGVFLGFPVPLFAPCGTALVQDNKIKVGEYFAYQGTTNSAGVLVNLWNSMPSRSVRAIVSRNTIDMVHSSPPADPNANFAGGVLLMDMEPNGSANVTTVIDHNVISGGAAVPARWGIGLRGSAHDLLVRENDTRSFTAAQAQMFIETTAHDGIYSGNVLGPVQPAIPGISPLAVLFCDGDNNRFFDNDFSMSNAPGWDNGGFGYVKLAEKSDHNVLVAPHLNTGQYLDAGVSHTNHLFAV